jgi:hypothetical protein
MSAIKKSLTNGLAATMAVAAIALIAVWQFYLFTTFKTPQGVFDAQGGTSHLWAAIGAAVVACVAGFFAFSISVASDEADEMHINS